MNISFSIVGTPHNKSNHKFEFTRSHFDAIYNIADGLLRQFADSNYSITHLVSGGSASIEHVAVKLYLDKKVPNLKLFIPCEFECGSFHDTGVDDITKNPGGYLNHLHKKFQLATNINSLSQIQIASAEGAELIPVSKGFFARCALISKSDFLLASTFGEMDMINHSEVTTTVQNYLDRVRKENIFDKSFHYDLLSGELNIGCNIKKKQVNIKSNTSIIKPNAFFKKKTNTFNH